MGHATNIEQYLFPDSKLGESKLTATVKTGKKAVLCILQILGFAILASFGIWPAMVYLIYLATTS
ncbi:hypothetical protein [Malonomonas rubra]|uniref:hypothetical protein n=1 Tax=Malonomonas rubra TaxID=57040 RepID=UPI0026F22182|nr:hypothetical protein [Malonomonas rubra]